MLKVWTCGSLKQYLRLPVPEYRLASKPDQEYVMFMEKQTDSY